MDNGKDRPTAGGPRPALLGQRLIRIAAITRGYFREARLEVLPETAIAVFIGDRRLVVYDCNDDVAQLDVRDQRVVAFCLKVKPAAIVPDPTRSDKAEAAEKGPEQAQNPGPEEDLDGPDW